MIFPCRAIVDLADLSLHGVIGGGDRMGLTGASPSTINPLAPPSSNASCPSKAISQKRLVAFPSFSPQSSWIL